MRQQVFAVFRQFGMMLTQPAPSKVVDASEMARHPGLPWRPTIHHDARPMGAYGVARDGEIVFVESGQRPAMRVWTLTHESAYHWHAEHNPHFALLEQEIREGFAPWAAYEMAGRLGHREIARRRCGDWT